MTTTPDIPGYSDLVQIAHGASSVVYRADDPNHARQVAIKVLRAPELNEEERLAYRRELVAMGQLAQHPHIVDLIGSGFAEGGHPYIVMPFYRNGSYAAFVERHGPLGWMEIIDFGVKVASALETAHRRGVVHRDVKPANIYRGEFTAQPILADFGVSSFVTPSLDGGPTVLVAGTPIFAAPEVLNGVRPTIASDLYSFGATLFALIEGRAAYADPAIDRIVGAVTSSDPPPRIGAEAPDGLRDLLAAMMAKDPTDRPAAALDVVGAMNALQRETGMGVTPPVIRTAGELTGLDGHDPTAAPTAEPRAGEDEPAADGSDSGSGSSGPHLVDRPVAVDPVPLTDRPTMTVKPLDRPTEPVGEQRTSARTGFRPQPPIRPRWRVAVAFGAVALIAGLAATAFFGRDDDGPEPGSETALVAVDDEALAWGAGDATVQAVEAHDGFIGGLAWSSDGARLATGGQDRRVVLWAVEPGGIPIPTGPDREPSGDGWYLDLSWSPGGDLALADSGGAVTVWPVSEGGAAATVAIDDGSTEAVAWSPDGRFLASGGADGTIRVLTPDGDERRTLAGHDRGVLTLGWSPTDGWVASGGQDGTARIWDADSGEEMLTVDGHDDWVRSVAWSPVTPALATAGSDGTVRIWDGRTGVELRRLDIGTDPTGTAVWSPGGSLVAVGGADGVVRIWDAARDRELPPLAGSSGVVALAWSPDGDALAVGREDGRLEIWSTAEADS